MLTEIKHNLARHLSGLLPATDLQIFEMLELPKNLAHGDLALPMFLFAKEYKQSPAHLAQNTADKINQNLPQFINSASAVGGFLNFKFTHNYLVKSLSESILQAGKQGLGSNKSGLGKKLIIDFSSPNVAKRMSIGHLRATVIGQAIYNLAKCQGYEVVGLNHLGDWGTQFGKLAWAIDQWGREYSFEKDPIGALNDLYVRFHDAAEKDPSVEKSGAEYFKRLEEGDAHIVDLWKKIVTWSLTEYQRLWDMLGVRHDLVRGESFYNDRLKKTEDLLANQGLLVESEGAMVVHLDGDMPPCLIRKADGASLYATRDLASAIYRMEELKSDVNLYVVGQDQTLHFKQVFSVLKKMGFKWADHCHHISFGMYRFKDVGRMSTRKGNVIYLDDVLNKAVELVLEIINEKNPDLKNKELVAKQIGVGAVIFNDLGSDRIKNVDFDWGKVINFDGDSGPYLQYVAVRCKSLIRKFGKKVSESPTVALEQPYEAELILQLLAYDQVVEQSFTSFKPHVLANYLLAVGKTFNHFYHHCRILGESPELESSRIWLVNATLLVLEQGLGLLNIEVPNEM